MAGGIQFLDLVSNSDLGAVAPYEVTTPSHFSISRKGKEKLGREFV
jgi:hypothetical protein